MIDVTVAALVYRSSRWLSFVLEGLQSSKNSTKYNTLIVANDPTDEIRYDKRVDYIHENDNKDDHYLKRVYLAWNKAVEIANTRYVCLLNSDMYVSDYFLDELMCWMDGKTIPCSTLVESGWIASAFPEYVRDFGRTPESFDREGFKHFAEEIKQPGKNEAGRLFMPCVFERETFMAMGGYPPGNVKTDYYEISGDRVLFNRYLDKSYSWITAKGSVVFHTQEGESRDNLN